MSLTLSELSEMMRDIDTCLLCTHADNGHIAARPMSNNRNVDWDASAWFFASDDASMVDELTANPTTMLAYQGEAGFWASVQGTATVHTDRDLMKEHWDEDIERWFEDGLDTDGLVLLEVSATRVSYWTYEHGDGHIDV